MLLYLENDVFLPEIPKTTASKVLKTVEISDPLIIITGNIGYILDITSKVSIDFIYQNSILYLFFKIIEHFFSYFICSLSPSFETFKSPNCSGQWFFFIIGRLSVCSSIFVCLTSDQIENDGDQKFGKHTLL